MNLQVSEEVLRQRSDYTYQFNAKAGRHGWLRLTPAYSLKIVEELIVGHPNSRRVFDPFCGTGTTALSAAYHGHDAITTDINPFLIWLATAKNGNYCKLDIQRTLHAAEAAIDLVARKAIQPAIAPPIHNIERWWNPDSLDFLCLLKAAIEVASDSDETVRKLLQVAFCRTLIELSNAAFNHQSMSFKEDEQLSLDLSVDAGKVFLNDVEFVLHGASQNPAGKGTVCFGDSRDPSATLKDPVDLVITSPPYANRMSYIRELRPYMYWLDFLDTARAAGELDWTAIGGTWGIATSRLNDWNRPEKYFRSENLASALDKIAHGENKNGEVLAKYVAKYFDDMWSHFCGLTPVLSNGAELHYIVGNSTFYGNLVSTERYYAEMLTQLGFHDVECNPIRKRNSKKELVEFDVVAKWR